MLSLKNFFFQKIQLPDKWKPYLSNYKTGLAIVFLLGCIAIIAVVNSSLLQKPKDTPFVIPNASYFSVAWVNIRADGANDDKIVVNFNQPVDPHAVSHLFFLSPSTKGTFSQGESIQEIVFIPEKPFRRGTSYSLKIGEGLLSKNGMLLPQDYIQNFHASLAKNQVQFMQDGISGRVVSVPVSSNKTIKVRGYKRFEKVQLKLYRSSKDKLMEALTYSPSESTTSDTYYTGYETFKQNTTPHEETSFMKYMPIHEESEELVLNLPQGIYYIEAVEDKKNILGATYVIATNVGISYRQDDKKILLSGFDLRSGRKLDQQVRAEFYNFEDKPTLIATHPFQDELTTLQFPFTTRVDAVIGTVGDDISLIPVRLPDSKAEINVSSDLDRDMQIFMYTDRPIYKPGDTIKYRGIIRQDGDGLYKIPPAGQRITVWRGYGEAKKTYTAYSNEMGVFSGEIMLEKDLQAGSESLMATVRDDDNYPYEYVYFDIADYVKPTFEIKTNVEKTEYLHNDKMSFTISANYFDGRPVADKNIRYTIYAMDYFETERAVYNQNFAINSQGGMCGAGGWEDWYGGEVSDEQIVKLDKNGKATVTYTLPKDLPGSKTVTLVAKANDEQNELVSAVNTTVHGGLYTIFPMPGAREYVYGSELVQPFYAETLEGQKLGNRDFTYTLSVNTSYEGKPKEIGAGRVTTDGNGSMIVKQRLPQRSDSETDGMMVYVTVNGTDDEGNKISANKYVFLRTKEQIDNYSWWNRNDIDQTYLSIVSSQNSFVVGDEIVLQVNSPRELDTLMSLERGRIYKPSVVHLVKGQNTIRIPVTDELSPSITVVFSFFADGGYYSEGVVLNVPAMHKLLTILVKPNKERYQPNETATLGISTRDRYGNGVPAAVSLGVVDKAIYGLRKDATGPIHSSFYFFRPRSTNASSSLTMVGNFEGGGGGGGGGGLRETKLVDTLYWNPNLMTDSGGNVEVTFPLGSTETTWRALVYGSTATSQVGQGDADFIVAK